jgi:Tfp pilus assembly protein PilO
VTARDRLILVAIGAIAVLGALWVLAVSPARKQASKVSSEVSSTRSQLSHALAEVAEARSAQSRYHVAYASLAQLGQAVPTSPEVPALVYALDRASNNHKVMFSSIASSASGTSSSPSSPAASKTAASAPFTQMPFALTFTGSYDDLIHLLGQVERFTVQVPGGPVEVSGRLLTIQSVTLAAATPSGATAASASSASSRQMTWTINAAAYVLAPTAQSSAPVAGGTQTAASAPSSSGAATATPAVIKVGG